ncbi:MAG TPA: hypothetical protein VFJ57_01915 [Solirubrobacterales bacterium]|nr:hypothetical protein [Solirubrobacterales bacterium]
MAESNETSELQKLRAQRNALDRELVRKSYRIGELEQESAAELEKVTRIFEESLSWRVTRPLRSVKELAGKLRHR